jgi:hypothetical protein
LPRFFFVIYLEETALGLCTITVGAFSDERVARVNLPGEEQAYIIPVGRK